MSIYTHIYDRGVGSVVGDWAFIGGILLLGVLVTVLIRMVGSRLGLDRWFISEAEKIKRDCREAELLETELAMIEDAVIRQDPDFATQYDETIREAAYHYYLAEATRSVMGTGEEALEAFKRTRLISHSHTVMSVA